MKLAITYEIIGHLVESSSVLQSYSCEKFVLPEVDTPNQVKSLLSFNRLSPVIPKTVKVLETHFPFNFLIFYGRWNYALWVAKVIQINCSYCYLKFQTPLEAFMILTLSKFIVLWPKFSPYRPKATLDHRSQRYNRNI